MITSAGILVLVIFASSCKKQPVNTGNNVTTTTTTTTSTTTTTTNTAPTLDTTKYSLVWSDEFSGTKVDTSKWNFETGGNGWGNNEQEYYQAANATVANGNLVITAKREQVGNNLFTSSRMTTQNKEAPGSGLIEARIKIPVGQGLWPAFWMLGANINTVSWPKCGEIDIMEHINTDNTIYGTMHWNNGGAVQYGLSTTVTNAADYHIYAVTWDDNSINWYVDGVKYVSGDITNSINNTGAFHLPFFIILNLAVGGNWPGQTVDTSLFPASMYVDYVRVYKAK